VRRAGEDYGRHACSELAAAIAYRLLFALVPFIALLAALTDAVMPDTARQDIVDWIVGAFPGATVEHGVQEQLRSSGALTSLAGVVAFGTLIWTASGITRSLRVALGVVWETEVRPEFVRAKLRDIAALGVLAALVVGSFGLSLATQIAVQAGVSIAGALGLGFAATAFTRVVELAVTGAGTFAALLVVYRLGAPARVSLAAAWPSALLTALAIDVAVAGYAFYLVRIASFDTIYGPLGAALAFLALVYIAAQLTLFGAELIRQSAASRSR
jgi:membrane protein